MPDTRIALSPLQQEYRTYFEGLLSKHDLKGLSGDEAKLKAFFTDVSTGWTKGEGKKSSLQELSEELKRISAELNG